MSQTAGLTAIRTGRACDAVIAQLEDLITSGVWPLGSRIPPEPELTAALGVGRNTVREAVRALEHAGMLAPRRGDGTYVRATSALGAAVYRRARQTDLLHVLDVRAGLERAAAEGAARNRTDADAAAVTLAVRARRAACDTGDADAFVAADLTFHRAVVAATGNPVLADLYDGLTEAVERTVAEISRLDDDHSAFRGHEELAAAIAAGDPVAAVAAADTYLDAARTIVERQP
ncbi:FadR/GntR family transcriptional regulator [Pseudonocardia sp. N23]|uniref:FadR/GntR family transcriptional regulator n=1 Tax=Pseudonocardia sp. N23 TaxID=1987376 RepID=UPI001C0F32D5|nr:FCD domain-containing protein [Pseudonocardia sp. N23]